MSLAHHPFYQAIKTNSITKKTALCVGLDPDLTQLPLHFPANLNGVKQFLETIIELTHPYCIAYKPNLAFFEALGIEGLQLLEFICQKIPRTMPIILDAKRGDIGNTSKMQARFIFDTFGAWATTLHPYMGLDSLEPFFEHSNKYHFVLTLTSNKGANDFEKQIMANGKPLYQFVAEKLMETPRNNVGFVVGATHPEESTVIRTVHPKPLFLVPGVGTQGGSYTDALSMSKNDEGLSIINVSRGILYASRQKDFDIKVIEEAKKYVFHAI